MYLEGNVLSSGDDYRFRSIVIDEHFFSEGNGLYDLMVFRGIFLELNFMEDTFNLLVIKHEPGLVLSIEALVLGFNVPGRIFFLSGSDG